jgi:hypothetical protein
VPRLRPPGASSSAQPRTRRAIRMCSLSVEETVMPYTYALAREISGPRSRSSGRCRSRPNGSATASARKGPTTRGRSGVGTTPAPASNTQISVAGHAVRGPDVLLAAGPIRMVSRAGEVTNPFYQSRLVLSRLACPRSRIVRMEKAHRCASTVPHEAREATRLRSYAKPARTDGPRSERNASISTGQLALFQNFAEVLKGATLGTQQGTTGRKV